MTLLRASNFCRRTICQDNRDDQDKYNDFFNQPGIPPAYDIRRNERKDEDLILANQAESMLRLKKTHVDVQILSFLCSYCKERHKRKRKQTLNCQYQLSTKSTTISNAGIAADIFSTVFISSSEILLHLNVFECKNLCLLSSEHSQNVGLENRKFLTTPVFLCLRSKKCECQIVKTPKSDRKNMKHDHQIVYVPPCVAANAGIFQYVPISMLNVSLNASIYDFHNLNRKVDDKMEHAIRWADEVHIREVAIPYIGINLCLQKNLDKNPKESLRDENSCIQNYFTSNIQHRNISDENANERYDERLFQEGYIFAIVDNNFMENKNQVVRFYQVISCFDESHTNNNLSTQTPYDYQDDIRSQHHKKILNYDSKNQSSSLHDFYYDNFEKIKTIYRVKPNRTKVVLLEKHSQINQPLLPSISSSFSYYSSIKLSNAKTRKTNMNRVKMLSKSNNFDLSSANSYFCMDTMILFEAKYTKDLVDAILVCSSMSNTLTNSFLPIVHVTGYDEEDIKKYVKVAADTGAHLILFYFIFDFVNPPNNYSCSILL